MCVSSEATVNERVDPEVSSQSNSKSSSTTQASNQVTGDFTERRILLQIKLKKLEQEIAALKNELSMHDTLVRAFNLSATRNWCFRQLGQASEIVGFLSKKKKKLVLKVTLCFHAFNDLQKIDFVSFQIYRQTCKA